MSSGSIQFPTPPSPFPAGGVSNFQTPVVFSPQSLNFPARPQKPSKASDSSNGSNGSNGSVFHNPSTTTNQMIVLTPQNLAMMDSHNQPIVFSPASPMQSNVILPPNGLPTISNVTPIASPFQHGDLNQLFQTVFIEIKQKFI